ncbi:YwiC-like family protein [Bacillus taeanensis]|uniref:YwiC-like family protein n=1 Tax=Bacillus taeanensis TaxID=273032 RepID=A0A366XWZ0_9BACI|nr:YwiC-like family protein [Bacillus taeanensis]RBW68664.1 hypothetical protein DS031_15000 [Bacillus taeanensis]
MKKLLLPKQHGAWVMVSLPYLIGVIVGGPKWIHLPLFIGWLFIYIASHPLILALKQKEKRADYLRWVIQYLGTAGLFLVYPLLNNPRLLLFGFILLPLFGMNIFFAKKRKERAFLNDMSAIIGLCLGGAASYVVGSGEWNETMLVIWGACILFFTGSVFFVKTMIREKKNPRFKWLSWGYHGALPVIVFISGFSLLALTYVPSVIRAIVCYGKPMAPKHIAIVEFTNSALFLIGMLIWLY